MVEVQETAKPRATMDLLPDLIVVARIGTGDELAADALVEARTP
jgi:hypothetical protein